jgi:hypothetical protein
MRLLESEPGASSRAKLAADPADEHRPHRKSAPPAAKEAGDQSRAAAGSALQLAINVWPA